ncbi:MAG: CNP1-like family protein [Sulfuricella sp.]|nr:CNP1-like family protein [Gammaproteobacteria bacterium]
MKKFLALLLFALPLAASAAEPGQFEEERSWTEIEAKLPPYPKEENLLPLFVSAASDNKFFVDAVSISVGEDGVARYTMIVKSPAGADNVSFEGIRCATREKKLYAFGRKEGSWSRARVSRWEPIRYQDINRHHHVLYDDFFCPNGIIVKSAQDAVDALRRGFRP